MFYFSDTDPPQIYNEDMLVYYSALGSPVTLSLRVRAYPEILDIDSAFMWSIKRSHAVTSFKLQEEVFQTQLTIASVIGTDYGEYIVAVNNGIKEDATFIIELRQSGSATFFI